MSFTEDRGVCGAFTYALTNQDDSPYDSTIFTFDPLVPSISIFTTDPSDIKDYYLKLTGTLTTWGSDSTILTIKIVKGCTLTTITTSPISNQTYYITESTLSISFSDWTSSVSGCGSFIYSS